MPDVTVSSTTQAGVDHDGIALDGVTVCKFKISGTRVELYFVQGMSGSRNDLKNVFHQIGDMMPDLDYG
jgi:hypothetical protein